MSGPWDCMFCGYDCSGCPRGICPECGRPVFRYTDRAREIIDLANEHAKRLLARRKSVTSWFRSWFIGGVEFYGIDGPHMLIAILTGPQGIGYSALQHLIADPAALVPQLEAMDRSLKAMSVPPETRLPLRPGAHRIVKQAVEEAVRLGDDYVGSEHFLLAICSAGDPGMQWLLHLHRVTHESVREFVLRVRQRPQTAAPDCAT